MKLAPRLTAKQFWDVWITSVKMVKSARDPSGLPLSIAEQAVRLDTGAKYGERVAAEGVAYFRRLMLDCQRLSSGDMPEKER